MSIFDELLPIGQKFTSPGRTISEGDFTLLTNLTWTTAEIHSNREYMKKTQFGDMILAGPCTVAVMIGMNGRGAFGMLFEEGKVRVVALLGLDEIRFRAPVLPGDTLTAHAELLDVRPSQKNPRRGILRVKDSATNQKGELVVESIRTMMIEIAD